MGAALLDLHRERGALINGISPMIGMAAGALGSTALLVHAPDPLHTVTRCCSRSSCWRWRCCGACPRPRRAATAPGPACVPHHRAAAGRKALLGVTPANVAVWMLGGFYLSLMPSLIVSATQARSPWLGGFAVTALTLSGAVAIALVALRRVGTFRTLLSGEIALASGLLLILIAANAGYPALLLAGSIVAGLGFGATFLGAVRTVLPLAEPHERAGLMGAFYVESYLANSVPTMIAGYMARAPAGGGRRVWRDHPRAGGGGHRAGRDAATRLRGRRLPASRCESLARAASAQATATTLPAYHCSSCRRARGMRKRGDDSFFRARPTAMTQPSATLAAILRAIPRRYRSTARPAPGAVTQTDPDSPIARLARAIEPLQAADASAQAPDGAVRAFIDALAALIDEALRPDAGDPCSRARCRNTATPSSVNTWNCAARKPPTSASCAPPSTPSRIRPPRLAPGAGRESLRGCTPRFLRDHGNRRRRPRKRC